MPPTEAITHILQGVAYGALVGGGIATAGFFMKKNRITSVDLGQNVKYVRTDHELLALLSKFQPLSTASPRCKTLYDTMVACCEILLSAEARKVKGNEQYKATRACAQTIGAAKALTRQAAKDQPGTKADLSFECMRDIENTLQPILNNHLHNLMLV